MTDDSPAMALLHEGLNLCVRARKLDERMLDHYTRETLPESAKEYPETWCKSLTPQLWEQDQYDKDLEAWEEKTRQFLKSI